MDSAIHRINCYPADKYHENQCVIHWREIYPVGSVIHLLNDWALMFNSRILSKANKRQFERRHCSYSALFLLQQSFN